jgi:hypothetical protein
MQYFFLQKMIWKNAGKQKILKTDGTLFQHNSLFKKSFAGDLILQIFPGKNRSRTGTVTIKSPDIMKVFYIWNISEPGPFILFTFQQYGY